MKTTLKYDCYYDYQQITEGLKQLQCLHPELMKIESIAVTAKGRDIWAVTLSNGNADEKPAFYIDGNTHAGEVTGSMAAMHTLDYLVTNYGTDEEVTKLVDNLTFYVIPRISPDGAEAYLKTANKVRSLDKNWPSETREDGLYQADVDNDGSIRMILVESAYGTYKKDETNEALLHLRQPDDVEGKFYNVYPEGFIQNYDGLHITQSNNLWGLDFNRNYPIEWQAQVRQPGAGDYPLSEIETKAAVDFILAHKNICFVVTHHTSGGQVIYPPGTRPSTTMTSFDKKILTSIGKMATQVTGYQLCQLFDDYCTDKSKFAAGAFDDWCYQDQGIPTFTFEIWNLPKKVGIDTDLPAKPVSEQQSKENYLKILEWVKENTPESYLPWTKYNHPELGEVEFGGIETKYVIQNPPKHLLLAEIENISKATLRITHSLPNVVFEDVEVTKLSTDTFKIDVVVANKGYLPTYLSDRLNEMKVINKLELTVSGDINCINSNTVDVGQLEGFSGYRTMQWGTTYMTNEVKPLKKKFTFYVNGKENDQVTLTVSSNKTGKLTKVITL